MCWCRVYCSGSYSAAAYKFGYADLSRPQPALRALSDNVRDQKITQHSSLTRDTHMETAPVSSHNSTTLTQA